MHNLDYNENRCIWSGEYTDELIPVEVESVSRFGKRMGRKIYFVQPEYKERLQSFCSFASRYSRWSLLILLLSILFFIYTSINYDLRGGGIGFASIGVVTYIFPFATPETIYWLGIRKSIKVVRIFSGIIILTGVIISILS